MAGPGPSLAVHIPTEGNSRWSGRDNDVQLRLVYTQPIYQYSFNSQRQHYGYVDATINIGVSPDADTRGRLEMDRGTKPLGAGWIYWHGLWHWETRCVQEAWHHHGQPIVHEDWVAVRRHRGACYSTKGAGQWFLDVKWGEDSYRWSCSSHHNRAFKITRRRHNHVNPWAIDKLSNVEMVKQVPGITSYNVGPNPDGWSDIGQPYDENNEEHKAMREQFFWG